jgi:alkaline phosphatase
LYAHSRRNHEDDSKYSLKSCKDIARQLIENKVGQSINVIMGGGMRSFVPEEHDGRRKDGKNLAQDWKKYHPNGEFVTSRDELMNVKENTEFVLGIFEKSHMHFNCDRNASVEPSIEEMTLKAIDILKRKNSKGYLLIVEAGKIDLAHHFNLAYRALDDTLAFESAVDAALKYIGKKFLK